MMQSRALSSGTLQEWVKDAARLNLTHIPRSALGSSGPDSAKKVVGEE